MLKVKVGDGGVDARTFIEARHAVGVDVHLHVDANQGWSPEQAVRIVKSLEDVGVGVELVEQPVRADDIDGLAFVTGRVQTSIMADESVWTCRDLREVVRSRAADMINIKLAKTGGLREALELVTMARECEVGVVVGCMSETHVGFAAAGALASALDARVEGEGKPHDLDGGLLVAHSPVDGGVHYDGDRVLLAETLGTGIGGLAASPSLHG